MGDVLSQSEIDSLLAALSSGELDADQIQESTEKQVKDYDFERPAKSTNFPVYLRKNIQVSVSSSETFTFSEFTNALSNPVILGIVDFRPLNGNIIIELSSNLGFAMIDRMLGGQGLPLEKTRDDGFMYAAYA